MSEVTKKKISLEKSEKRAAKTLGKRWPTRRKKKNQKRKTSNQKHRSQRNHIKQRRIDGGGPPEEINTGA